MASEIMAPEAAKRPASSLPTASSRFTAMLIHDTRMASFCLSIESTPIKKAGQQPAALSCRALVRPLLSHNPASRPGAQPVQSYLLSV